MSTQDRLLRILDENLGVVPSSLHQKLHQLGLDSLDQAELVVQIEQEFGVEMEDSGLDGETTITELLYFIEG